MMGPGEGQNGMCDDCVTGETKRQQWEEQMARMIRAKDWTQLEVEDFLNESKVM